MRVYWDLTSTERTQAMFAKYVGLTTETLALAEHFDNALSKAMTVFCSSAFPL